MKTCMKPYTVAYSVQLETYNLKVLGLNPDWQMADVQGLECVMLSISPCKGKRQYLITVQVS